MAKRRRRNRVLAIFFMLFLVMFAVSVFFVGRTLYENKKAADAFDALRAQQMQAEQAAEDAAEALAEGFDVLHAENADYAGWLKIEGTKIDYPVMYTPSAPEYYLRRAFDQSYSASGTPFIGEGADMNSDCLIIYGHEMQDGSMFGALDEYADPAFREAHPRVTIYLRDEMRTYEIFAAVKTRILGSGEEGYRYYNAAGALDQAGFQALSGWLSVNALYESGITPVYGEQILLLSTCSYHTENGRFVVAARRVS